MNFIPAQCAAQSLGPANQMVNLLIHTILSSYCTIANPGFPSDCGITVANETHYDYIVVGAGTAGSIVAGRLSEDPTKKVLLIEAGGDPPVESEMPNGYFALLNSDIHSWVYEEYAENACLRANGSCFTTRGKMLGGSSAHNGLVYTRGRKYDFDYWASLGNKGWDYYSMLKYFKRWEGNQDPIIANYANGFYHNQTGPLKVSFMYRDPTLRVFLDAAVETGNERVLDINAGKTLGYLYQQGYVYNGTRQSAAKAYLIPPRPNLCVVKNSIAHKILFDENKKAIGVVYEYNEMKNITAYADKEVILSAGTIENVKLLHLSGIGPKSQLDKFNIPVISDLPVGHNLYEHVNLNIFWQFDGEVPSPTELVDDTFNYLVHRSGPLTSVGDAVGALDNPKNNSQCEKSEIQLVYVRFARNAINLQNYNDELVQTVVVPINEHFDVGVAIPKITQPKSVGYIKLQSASFKDPLFINANYFDNPDDLETMVQEIKRQVAFEKTISFRKQNGKLIRLPLPSCDQIQYKTDDYWRCYARYLSETAFHSVGTCKMAPQSDSGVVDDHLRVYGVTNLRVADASIMPYIVSNDLSATVLTTGEKAAAMIKEDHS